MKSQEKPQSPEREPKKLRGWSKVVASLALVGALSGCGDFPNDEFVVNPGTQTEKFNVEYRFSGGGGGDPTIIDYNVLVSKNGEVYEGRIEQKDGFFTENKKIQSNSVDELFQEISKELDSEGITDETREGKNNKVIRAKEIFNDSILSNPNPTDREIRIKYKKK